MSFYNKLLFLIADNETSVKNLAKKLAVNTSVIYTWKNEKYLPSLKNAVDIANYFNCSLDYLFGEISLDYDLKYKATPAFGKQLKRVMKKCHISQYKMIKDKICSSHSFTTWFVQDATPNMTTVIKLAEYFNLSLDEFVGRV